MSTVIEKPPAEPGTPPANPTPTPAEPTPAPAPTPAPPPPEPVEIAYDVKLTKDSPLDAKADVDKIVAFAKAHKLTNEQAQALAKDVEDVGVRLAVRTKESALQSVEAAKSKFLEESKADPVIGGAKFDDTVRDVERALNWLAVKIPDDVKRFRAEIGQTAYGNYPPYLKMFALIGKAVAQDQTPIIPSGVGEEPPPKPGKRMFPNLPE